MVYKGQNNLKKYESDNRISTLLIINQEYLAYQVGKSLDLGYFNLKESIKNG